MADKKQKLTAEQKKQLEQLQQMLQSKGQGLPGMAQKPGGIQGMMGGMPKKPPYTAKGFLVATLQLMQESVKFIDQFTNFIINRKTKDSNDVLSSSRSPIVFGFWIIFIFVFLGTLWAATAPLDSAAVAIGAVISDTKKRVINHPEGGIIKKIYVNIGDQVNPGDKLLEFDDTRVKTEYESILSVYRNTLASESRLVAEINNLDQVSYPEFLTANSSDPEVMKIIKTNDNLFFSKKEAMESEIGTYKERINQSRKQIEGLQAKKEAAKKSLAVTKDRLDATKKLHNKGFAQKAQLLEFEEREARLYSEVAIADTEIARTEQQVSEFEMHLVNSRSKMLASNLSELKEIQTKLPQYVEQYRELKDKLGRILITAQVQGIVNKIEYTTVGSSVQPLVPLLEISPRDDKLVIEAKIKPRSIDSIREGQATKIRFSAFKSRVSPIFLGEVISISPDIVMEPNKPQPDAELQAGYYVALVELDAEDFAKKATPRQLTLRPGMQAEVQIITGERTLLRYLLDPVVDAMFKGFKER